MAVTPPLAVAVELLVRVGTGEPTVIGTVSVDVPARAVNEATVAADARSRAALAAVRHELAETLRAAAAEIESTD